MRGHIQLLLVALSLVGGAALFVWHSTATPRVFVLQSYDGEYPWTEAVEVGLKRVLGNGAGRFAVRWHYMDTKRNPWPEYRAHAALAARQQIDSWRPNVLIAIDDDAQELVARHYLGLPDVSVVFAGVNAEITSYGYDGADNVTGILERTPWDAMKEALLQSNLSHARPLRLLHVGDGSLPVVNDDRHLHAFSWGPQVELLDSRIGNRTFDEWKSTIAQVQDQADILLIDGYRQLARSRGDPTLVPPREVVAWTEAHSRLPLIGNNGFFVEDGGGLAIGASPYEQGEVAARMAMDILEGRRPKELPITSTRQLVVFMRESTLRAKGLRLPGIYEAFARASDHFQP